MVVEGGANPHNCRFLAVCTRVPAVAQRSRGNRYSCRVELDARFDPLISTGKAGFAHARSGPAVGKRGMDYCPKYIGGRNAARLRRAIDKLAQKGTLLIGGQTFYSRDEPSSIRRSPYFSDRM
jgi:hypothetical protein